MSKVTIHVGLHKTGTSYLQSVLFKELKAVAVHRGYQSHRQLMDLQNLDHLVISDEGLSGRLWSGSYLEDFQVNMTNLAKIYGQPKIIFGIRNHEGFIRSVYKQYLHQKGFKDFEHMFNSEGTGLIKPKELLLLPKIELLKKTFNDVFIYSQESLRTRQDDFLQALIRFLDLDVDISSLELSQGKLNVGVNTRLQVNTLKKLNRLNAGLESVHPLLGLYTRVFRKLKLSPRQICQGHLRSIKSQTFDLDDEVKSFIQSYYHDDWKSSQGHISY